jgi:probable phosphoglycerate mutase
MRNHLCADHRRSADVGVEFATVEIALIRHAEPEWVREGYSVDNPPLTVRGHRQARRLADVLETDTYDGVYVSPLTRARQTAAPILDAQRRGEVIEPWLEEIRSPIWHGTPADKAQRAYQEEKQRRSSERWAGLEGGESVRDFVERIRSGATQFFAQRGIYRVGDALPVWHVENPGERLALIAHAGTNSVLICVLLGLDPTPWEWERFVLGHASISRLKALKMGDGWGFSLFSLADDAHLEPHDRTY